MTAGYSIRAVVSQHLEEVIHLRGVRSTQVKSAHVELGRLARTDERIIANLDGVLIAGAEGLAACSSSLNPPNRGAVFAATFCAINAGNQGQLQSLFDLCEIGSEATAGCISAIGWVSATSVKNTIDTWLHSVSPMNQIAGLSACHFHKIDPRTAMPSCLQSDRPQVVFRAMRVAAGIGLTEFLPQIVEHAASDTPDQAEANVWSAVFAVILGNRATALSAIKSCAIAPAATSRHCFHLAILAMPIEPTYAWLREWASVAKEPWVRRRLIRGCGLSGDVRYIPWLIEQMNDLTVSRLAGESFSFITGAHLALLDLERKPPENAPSGPNDDPADENVAMDEDEGLPWPDVARVHAWWTANAARFPAGHRYLVGAPASEAQCLKVLRSGGQRQRAVAAVTRCLLRPGTPLFQVAAPAWRQQRWLTELGA